MPTEFLGGSIKLIAHHGRAAAALSEGRQHLSDAIIGARRVEGMYKVLLAESAEHGLEQRVLLAAGNGPYHQQTNAVANELPHSVA